MILIVESKSKKGNPKIIIVGQDEGGGYGGQGMMGGGHSMGGGGGPMVMDTGSADEDDVLIVAGGGSGGGSMMMIDDEDDKKMKKLEKLMKMKKKMKKKKKGKGPILILLPDKQEMPKYEPSMEMVYEPPKMSYEQPKMYDSGMMSGHGNSMGGGSSYPSTAASSQTGIPAPLPMHHHMQHPMSYALPMMYPIPPQMAPSGSNMMMPHDMQSMMMAMFAELKMARMMSKLEKMMDY
jgi:hypothetical protein